MQNTEQAFIQPASQSHFLLSSFEKHAKKTVRAGRNTGFYQNRQVSKPVPAIKLQLATCIS
jgi:hypothetical protein